MALLRLLCPSVALRGRHVALLCSLCTLSWPLRGFLWPPCGLTLLSLLPVLALAWPWPPAGLAYFAFVFGCWTLAGLLSWPLHAPCGHTLPFSASSFCSDPLSLSRGLCSLCLGPCATFCGPAWHVWPCVALPCLPCFLSRFVMAFCGLLVAFLHFLSWPLRGPPWPQRGHYLLCCFPHLRHPWVDPLAHGVACVLAASSFRPA